MPIWRSRPDRPAEFATGLETDARRLIGCFEHHRHFPADIVERLDVGELDAPVAANVDLLDGAPRQPLVSSYLT